ncbi:hypothetical protein N2152v2_003852 [Parachlorella kessleri]
MASSDAQRVERALQLLDARLAKADLFNDGTIKIVPATSNVGPLGLFAFALTTALLQGQFTTVADGPTGVSGLVMGYGMFYGGLAQLIAGILEYQRKNTFGTVAFCSYGAFWMGLSYFNTIRTVVNGITPQISSTANGVTLYKAPVAAPVSGERTMLILWGILTFLFWLCTFSMNLVTSALFFSLALLFWFLAGGQPQASHMNWMKFAGAWGWWVAFLAFYDGIAALMKEVYGKQILPVFPFKPINRVSGGNFGTQRRIDTQDLEEAKQ